MVLLMFFLVAFAAAFTVIMNDREGYRNFGVSMLTSATMAIGEFDFKETFLRDQFAQYSTFYWLRIWHLIVFLIVMPIIVMSLLLGLAGDDTSGVMERVKLQRHIQMVSLVRLVNSGVFNVFTWKIVHSACGIVPYLGGATSQDFWLIIGEYSLLYSDSVFVSELGLG